MASLVLLLVVIATTSSAFAVYTPAPGLRYQGGCGQINYRGGFRIINGIRARPCEFPWMALVRLQLSRGVSNCGGSIISPSWILTAAHCIIRQGESMQEPHPSRLKVRTGSLDKWADYLEHNVEKAVIHNKYINTHLPHDIALLKLASPIKYDGCHVPVCLNSDTSEDVGVHLTCKISGWGRSSTTESLWPRNLLWAYDEILSRDECKQIYRSYATHYTLCGRATMNYNRGFCSSDSGGPLVCKNEADGRWYQHGIVSLYIGSRLCHNAGLYSNVASYRRWILDNMK